MMQLQSTNEAKIPAYFVCFIFLPTRTLEKHDKTTFKNQRRKDAKIDSNKVAAEKLKKILSCTQTPNYSQSNRAIGDI